MTMNDTDTRQLANDRDYWKLKCEAMEKKYGPLKGKSFLAIVARTKGRRLEGETIYVEDAADAVRVSNFLKRIEDDLVRSNERKGNQP